MTAETKRVARDHSHVRHATRARAIDELYLPQPAPTVGEKERLYDLTLSTIGDLAITYLEFGVHKGWSIQRIMRRFTAPDARFFGFDSFVGLPETWSDVMGPGYFSTQGTIPQMADSRAAFVKGWFQNTLPKFLSDHPMRAPVLVHFDADLYSSTLFLLTTLWHHIPDYYFIFDEFPPDEVSAMYDFSRAYPIAFEFIGCTNNAQSLPQQVFGHMQAIPMVVPDGS